MPKNSILIVDDMSVVRETTEGFLEGVRINGLPDARFDYLQAPDAEKALDIIQRDVQGEISMIIVDREMPPGMNGSDMLRLLSQVDPRAKNKLKIMVTGEMSDRAELNELLTTNRVNALFRKDGFVPKIAAPALKLARALHDPDLRKLPRTPAEIPLVPCDPGGEKRIVQTFPARTQMLVENFLDVSRRALMDKFGVLLTSGVRTTVEKSLKQ